LLVGPGRLGVRFHRACIARDVGGLLRLLSSRGEHYVESGRDLAVAADVCTGVEW
jgi:hypothetical protein